MQIEEVSIKNYKSFSKSSVKVGGFKNINMVYGYNNSGKSNFIKFLELIFKKKEIFQTVTFNENNISQQRTASIGYLNFWESTISNMPFIFRHDNRKLPIDFECRIKMQHDEMVDLKTTLSSFLNATHEYATINIKGQIIAMDDVTSKISLIEAKLNKKIIYQNSSPFYFPGSKIFEGNKKIFEYFLGLLNDCVLFLENDRNLVSELWSNEQQSQLSSKNFKNWLYNLYMESPKYAEFIEFCEFLKKFKTENIEKSPLKQADLGFSKFGDNIDVMLKNGSVRLPLSNFGTGIHQIFYILAKIFFSKARIILIEELELNLSPKYQRELFYNLNTLIENKKIDQVFFTTHSKYFTFRSDLKIFEATIDNQGITSINRSKATKTNKFFRIDL